MNWAALFFTSLVIAMGSLHIAQAGVDDLRGKEWRHLNEATGLTWNQVAQLCPQDGISPCVGSINGRKLTGWVWATEPHVVELFGYYVPEILTSPAFSVAGTQYFALATQFQSTFGLAARGESRE